MHWFAHAPANIALIKYMGKKDEKSNLPDNASLSYTLEHLVTTVKLEVIGGSKDSWEPLDIPGGASLKLSVEAQKRFIRHLERMKAYFNYRGHFLIQSCNNFPHGSGLASSASSFAALTRCAALALADLTNTPLLPVDTQAQFSRQGSGSSCRSFYSPWALWRGEEVLAPDLPYMSLIHQVVVVSGEEKEVSSSEAHQRVKTSPLYAARGQRAEARLNSLLKALNAKDWEQACHICWSEFQDMHALFRSCDTPFSYMNERSLHLLEQLQAAWKKNSDGPLVTMDAGPNIHLLYRPDQAHMAHQFKQEYLVGQYDVL